MTARQVRERMVGPASLWAFEGDWRLERRIEHACGQGDARLDGMARFLRAGATLIQEETGTLWVDGAAGPGMQAMRRYLWRAGTGSIEVSFEDGRPFHGIPLGVVEPGASHHCSPDLYCVSYNFSRWPVWQSVWRVTGPRKDYVMTSRFAPAG